MTHGHVGCGTAAHLSRRSFLAGATSGALGLLGFGGMVHGRGIETLAREQKHVVVFWLSGGVSQLETWDPKPGTDTGGPFESIETSVPGIRICELLPHTAQQMHHLALVRGINTRMNDHGKGAYIMQTGYNPTPGFEYPYLGSALSSLLIRPENPLPGYLSVGAAGKAGESSFLGPRFAPVSLLSESPPKNLAPPADLDETADLRRRGLRDRIGERFARGRAKAHTEAYDASYDQAAALVARRSLFDFGSFPAEDVARYGTHDFARHCLMARRLVEAGATFVKVGHTNYDTHSENFDFHVEQLGEFDRPFATFVADLAESGLLKQTLIVVMCEFGRTPKINQRVGRDHWGTAWSIALGGAGIKGGVAVGATNANGTAVADRQVDGGHLFHTYYKAVGLDPQESFWHNARPFHRADPKASAIHEVLA